MRHVTLLASMSCTSRVPVPGRSAAVAEVVVRLGTSTSPDLGPFGDRKAAGAIPRRRRIALHRVALCRIPVQRYWQPLREQTDTTGSSTQLLFHVCDGKHPVPLSQ